MELQHYVHTAPSWRAIDRRQDSRTNVNLAGLMVINDFDDAAVRLVDLSRRGCRVHSDAKVSTGTFVTLAVPGFRPVIGWVAWRKDAETGVDFANPLLTHVVCYMVGLSEA